LNRRELLKGGRARLLVSVKSAQECVAAIRGGAEIIDIKDPERGSLGRCDEITIREIVQTASSIGSAIPFSVALGELREWDASKPLPDLPEEIRFVKVGLSSCGEQKDWMHHWRHLRERFSSELSWVMVIYADDEPAQSPPPGEILDALRETQGDAVLVDTFRKDGRSLVEILSLQELKVLADRVHELGLPLAVAGSLRLADLSNLEPISPEIVAIRSAACRDNHRDGPICPERVAQFRQAIERFPSRL
jgi:(5-formylfuran-3-yl)methyl phosphate synthase